MNFLSKSGLTMLLISFISLSLGMEKPITPIEQRIKRQITAITESYNRKRNKNITNLICALATPKTRYYIHLFMDPDTINARTTQGQTALAVAARNNLTSEAALLIKNGSYINSQDNDGNTPLIKAAKRGNSEMVRLLLNYGASTEIKNHTNETAAQIAYTAGHRILAALLITNSNTTVDLTAEKNDSKKDMEIEQNIDNNQSRKRKRTAAIYNNRKFSFPCLTCNKAYPTQSKLNYHETYVHTPCACSDCGEIFSSRNQLSTHKRKQHKHVPNKTIKRNIFNCLKCKDSFNTEQKLKNHFALYHKEKAHPCPDCKRSFNEKENLEIHQKLDHSEPKYYYYKLI